MDSSPLELTLQWVWPKMAKHPLRGAALTIGRDDGVSLHLEGAGVSHRHAELYRQGPLYAIRDLGSTNGTWLDGKRVEHVPVSPGSVLRIGEWVGLFLETNREEPRFGELAPDLWGGSRLGQHVERLRRVAPSTLPILLVGETGTGKERFARATHSFSGRSGPFVAVNCAALPEQLAEAELFGYRRGAFTGAERPHHGVFRAAHGGTLFLDELQQLSAPVQAKLLRVLDDGRVTGLGDTSSVAVDARIVGALQRPASKLVAEGRLREDLAARLSGFELVIPPLRERCEDIPQLFVRFLAVHGAGEVPSVQARLVEALCLYDWPQNVRQLELLARQMLAVSGHEPLLRRRHLPAELAELVEDLTMAESSHAPCDRKQYDLSRLRQTLATNGGNVTAAAQALGISRQRIYRLLDDATEASSNGGLPRA